jgi:microcystin-dependent protein
MSDAFTGEIRMFGFTFAPLNWALTDGAILPVTRNTQLFSLLGTNFGGNGTTTFALPNLQGQVVVGAGTAVTGTQYGVGEQGGEPIVQIAMANTPAHTHQLMAAVGRGLLGNDNIPGPTKSFISAQGCTPYLPPTTNPPPTMVNMDVNALSPFTNTNIAPHTNMMPTISMTFCICLSGIFPPRT